MPQEKQAGSPAQEPPLSSTSVQFIGIYDPDSVDPQVTSQRPALDPTPWESAAMASPEDGTATGPSTFPPKRYAVPAFVATKQSPPVEPRSMKRNVPVSSYYFGPPPSDSAFFTPPVGQIGVHHPREIVRVERDYSGGEIVQFASTYPVEFEGRVSLFLSDFS
jgi:hypothetical protein